MSMACGILALNCESHLASKLALDSRVLALVLVLRVQASASASAFKVPGLNGLVLGLEGPGLGLDLEGLDNVFTLNLLNIAYARITLPIGEVDFACSSETLFTTQISVSLESPNAVEH